MRHYSLLLLAALGLQACSSTPKVTYHKIESNKDLAQLDGKISDSYFLNTTLVTISVQEPKDPQKPGPLTYLINAEPVEAQNFKVGVEPHSSMISTTKLNIVKVENTDRFQSGGTETVEHLKATITAVGGLVAKAVALGGSGPGPAETRSCSKALAGPFVIDVSKYLNHLEQKGVLLKFVENDPTTNCVQMDIGPLPQDAIPIERYPWNVETSDYYYSACRNVTLKVAYPDQRILQKTIRIADPYYVQRVRYPYKGSITMHSQCGVSVNTETMPNPSYGLEVAAELLKQVGDIKNAK